MRHFASRLKIAHRFYLLVGLFLLGSCSILAVAAYNVSSVLFQERGEQTRRVVEAAHSLVVSYANLAKTGQMTVDEAKQQALAHLSAMRYDKIQYFWVNDMSGVVLMHPTSPNLIGTKIIDLKDITGARIFADMIDLVATKGGGHYDYYWPADETARLKKTYVLGFPEWGWVIGSGVFVNDVADLVRQQIIQLSLATALIIFALGIVAFVISRGVVRPVGLLTKFVQELAGGNTAGEVPAVERGDEVGAIARAVEVFKQHAVERERLEAEKAAEQRAQEQRTARVDDLIGHFREEVEQALKTVGDAATDMQDFSQAMSATAEETSRQAMAVAAASEQASVNVQTVASAAEELAASVQEIGQQVARSTQIADRAVAEADKTNAKVQMLSESAERIGDVIRLISDIAAQTNLLALNTTIEAARAGEAGRGFAVVASEVKSLATQTARATQDIAQQIKSIQGATAESVGAIEQIGQTIRSMNEIAAAIAAAVEEQQAATQEIARNVQQASAGTSEVSSSIGGVSGAAAETGATSARVLQASQHLARQSERLRGDIGTFLTAVRAA